MSHDLKSPLTAIRGYADLMLEDVEAENRNREEDREFLGHITDSVDSMTTLIADLLNYSRISQSGELELASVDLNKVLAKVLPMFRLEMTQRNVKLDAGPLPVIKGHAETLRTVFQNLISNGIKYQPAQHADHRPTIRMQVPGAYLHPFSARGKRGLPRHRTGHVDL